MRDSQLQQIKAYRRAMICIEWIYFDQNRFHAFSKSVVVTTN